jgi:hypothetical protein
MASGPTSFFRAGPPRPEAIPPAWAFPGLTPFRPIAAAIYNRGLHNSKYEEPLHVIIAIEWRASLELTRTEW